MNANSDLPKPSIEERVYLDDLARERGWSKRKLDYLAGGRQGNGRLVYWQDSPRGRRYTDKAHVEVFDRAGLKVNVHTLASSNEGRVEKLESRMAKLESELLEVKASLPRLLQTLGRAA